MTRHCGAVMCQVQNSNESHTMNRLFLIYLNLIWQWNPREPREHKPRKLNEYVYATPDYQAEFKYVESSLLYYMNLCCYPVRWVTGAVHGQLNN